MKLVEYQLQDFVRTLASGEPTPGGGSASALLGSLGAALTAMVANLTTGKEKFKEKELVVQEILKDSQELTEEFLVLVDQDTVAFDGVTAVFRMPRGTEDEKAQRAAAMQQALKFATQVPYQIMEAAHRSLIVLKKGIHNTNPSALSDLGVAVHCLTGAMQGAWLNVLINLGSIKDDTFVAQYKRQGQALLSESLALAANLQKEIETSL